MHPVDGYQASWGDLFAGFASGEGAVRAGAADAGELRRQGCEHSGVCCGESGVRILRAHGWSESGEQGD